MDDERIALLLDGRVDGVQREDDLRHFATVDADYIVFADTAGMLRALEDEDAANERAG